MWVRKKSDIWTCCWLVMLMLTVPGIWILYIALAVAFHEICHGLALLLMGKEIDGFHITPAGVVMLVDELSCVQDIICSLAGPAGSFALTLFFPVFPKLAVCGTIHGLYNLIPVLPMDGGRFLRSSCILLLKNRYSEIAFSGFQHSLLIMIFTLGLFLSVWGDTGMIPLVISASIAVRYFSRNISCIESGQAVQ